MTSEEDPVTSSGEETDDSSSTLPSLTDSSELSPFEDELSDLSDDDDDGDSFGEDSFNDSDDDDKPKKRKPKAKAKPKAPPKPRGRAPVAAAAAPVKLPPKIVLNVHKPGVAPTPTPPAAGTATPPMFGILARNPIPLPKPIPTSLPSLSGLAAKPVLPSLPGLAKPGTSTLPSLPSLPGKSLPPAAKPFNLTVAPATLETLVQKMPGITLDTKVLTSTTASDINDLLVAEEAETTTDFEARRRLTLQIANLPNYKLNNVTVVTLGFLIMKRAKLGLSYGPDIDLSLDYLLNYLSS